MEDTRAIAKMLVDSTHNFVSVDGFLKNESYDDRRETVNELTVNKKFLYTIHVRHVLGNNEKREVNAYKKMHASNCAHVCLE